MNKEKNTRLFLLSDPELLNIYPAVFPCGLLLDAFICVTICANKPLTPLTKGSTIAGVEKDTDDVGVSDEGKREVYRVRGTHRARATLHDWNSLTTLPVYSRTKPPIYG